MSAPNEGVRFIARGDIDATAWDACVAASTGRVVYGYSWYLDAVLPAPGWTWLGLILDDEAGGYRAVMPVPLRRKGVAGVAYRWVVHQPLFCQWLGVFSPDASLDPTPFFGCVLRRFRYGSILSLNRYPNTSVPFDVVRQAATHVLDLSVGYEALYQRYTPDRRRNLRRAHREFGGATHWRVVDSADPEPLLTLFRDHHAGGINGGVGEWAYSILRTLTAELVKRNLATLRYAVYHNRVEAGALFVREGQRITYLFNAASERGRRSNARTWLIDQLIRENAGTARNTGCLADGPFIFDFESPQKPSIIQFYQSFGAVAEPFWLVNWSRLTVAERIAAYLIRQVVP